LILALDTASKASSIAVSRGDQVLALVGTQGGERRSERLWVQVEFLLKEAAVTLDDVDLFAVCSGPGGFTGLRIGIAATKGFALASGSPAIGVTSLEAAAFSSNRSGPVLAMVNRYKDEVYSQLFSISPQGLPVAESQPSVSKTNEAIEAVGDRLEIAFAGNAAQECLEIISEIGGDRMGRGWTVCQSPQFAADCVARLALMKYHRGERLSAESLKACYVRKAEAEVKLSLGLLGTKIRRSLRKD
jgi:tRNA threonylcarbamoyladenosine biosynthesis protein TsaB